MSSPFEHYGTSEDAEVSGFWLNFGGYEIRLARAGGKNVRFDKVREQYFEPYRRASEVGALDEATAIPVLAEVYADTVILGWRTKLPDGGYVNEITGPGGEPWAYNRENVIKLMTMLPDFFAVLRKHALDYSNFRKALAEAAVKN